jgi:hypothetical protein
MASYLTQKGAIISHIIDGEFVACGFTLSLNGISKKLIVVQRGRTDKLPLN